MFFKHTEYFPSTQCFWLLFNLSNLLISWSKYLVVNRLQLLVVPPLLSRGKSMYKFGFLSSWSRYPVRISCHLVYTLCIPCVYLVCTLCVHEHIRYTYCNLDVYFLYTQDNSRIRHEYCLNKRCATAFSADFKQNLRNDYSEFRRIKRKGLLMRSNLRVRIIWAARCPISSWLVEMVVIPSHRISLTGFSL